MTRPADVPDEILAAGRARSAARRAKDWAEADRLRAVIEAAGWTIVDRGYDSRFAPALPADLSAGGATIHGSSASVPSRLDEPADRAASVVLSVDDPDGLPGLFALGGAAADTQLIAIGEPDRVAAAPDGVEIVRVLPSVPLGGCLNAGIRRSTGAIIVLLGGAATIAGDVVGPLVRALEDPAVAIAGGWGSTTRDLRTFTPATVGDEADVIDLGCLAFRRADFSRIGAIDERIGDPQRLGAWLSLAMRFGSANPAIGEATRPRAARIVAIPATPRAALAPLDTASAGHLNPAARRALRRDFYRLHDAFGPIFATNRARRA